MTRAYTALIIAFLSCFIAFLVVDANVVLKVTGDNVNLRAIADGESEVVSQVSCGTILHADKYLDDSDWIGVAVPAGVAVWVYAELVRDDVVAVSKLSVRSGPGINYRTVGMLLKGTKVRSHGTLNGWLKISAPASCRVWISRKYVEPVDSVGSRSEQKTNIKSVVKKTIVVKPVHKPVSISPKKIVAEPVLEVKSVVVAENSPEGELSVGKVWLTEPTLQGTTNGCSVGSVSQESQTHVVNPVSKEPRIDESVTELDSMSKIDELKDVTEKPVVLSAVSEVIATPEAVVMPLIIDNEVGNIEPDKAVVVSVVEDLAVVEPEAIEVVEVDRYASIDTNSIPASISLSSLVLSMPQGKEVVLSGKLKRAGHIFRHRPSRYRLVSESFACYVISENDNLGNFLWTTVEITGKSYWVQGVRDMILVVESIKKISAEPLLP